MKSLSHDDIFDSIFTSTTLLKATTFGIALIELKLIFAQKKQIESFETFIGDFDKLISEMETRDDMPNDLLQKINSLVDSKNKKGE